MADLEEIGDYIALEDPRRAELSVDQLKAHCHRLASMPRSYPARDDIWPGLRMAVHGRYLILFRDLAEEVRIERILHGARDLQGLLP